MAFPASLNTKIFSLIYKSQPLARRLPNQCRIGSSFLQHGVELRSDVRCLGTGNVACPAPSLLRNRKQKHIQQVRSICGRENCADPCDWPPCSPENLAKTECMQKRVEKKAANRKKTIYEVYWNRPECCDNTCMTAYPRFDDMYYQESDKDKRIYTQTWNECPDLVILPKPICCSEKIKIASYCKRPKAERPKTACVTAADGCTVDLRGACPKLTMPCCRPARYAGCKRFRPQMKCEKFRTPFPSFSECRRDPLRDPKATECWCLAAPSMCQVWAEWRRLQMKKRSST